MTQRITQSKLEIFQAALNNNKLDWRTFFQLDDERADAILSMIDAEVLTTEKAGHYRIQAGTRGIVTDTRDLVYGQGRIPVYFTTKEHADTLINFYKKRSQKVTLTEL